VSPARSVENRKLQRPRSTVADDDDFDTKIMAKTYRNWPIAKRKSEKKKPKPPRTVRLIVMYPGPHENRVYDHIKRAGDLSIVQKHSSIPIGRERKPATRRND